MAPEREASESSGSAAVAEASIDAILPQLSHVCSLQSSSRTVVRRLVGQAASHGERYGFTSFQATRIARVALRGGKGRKSIAPAFASRLLQCIRPAPDQLFGTSFVLTVLGSLGGDPETGLDIGGLDDPMDEHFVSSDEESDDDDVTNDTDRDRKRKATDIKIQAIALRMLLYLLSPPPVFSLTQYQQTAAQGQVRNPSIPASFFNANARKTLDRCYGVLFQFLEYQTLRSSLCHLLCLITRRKHVRHYRIVKVLSLRARMPHEVHIAALLNTYAAFYPDMLFSESTASRQVVTQNTNQVHGLRYPGMNWLMQVHGLWQGRSSVQNGQTTDTERQTLNKARKGRRARGARRPQKSVSELLAHIVPPPTVLMTQESTLLISEIASYRELGYRFDNVQMPDQLATALAHRTTSLALFSKQTNRHMARAFSRVHQWTTSAISDFMSIPLLIAQGSLPLERSDVAHDSSASLMEALCSFVSRVGGCDAQLQARLSRILKVELWQQLHPRERRAFLTLVQFFIPMKRETFEQQVLAPILGIAQQVDGDEAALIVHSLAIMLTNWADQDWQSIFRQFDAEQIVHWGSVMLSPKVDYADTIATTIVRTTRLASSLLARRPRSIMMLHACLLLNEATFVEGFVGLHDLLLPPTFALYMPGFSQHGAVMSLSRQLGLVHNIRQLHQDYLVGKTEGKTSETTALDGLYVPAQMRERRSSFFSEACSDRINDCVILLIDLVWRNNGFVSVEAGTADIGLPIEFFVSLSSRCQSRGDELERIGSASHSATLGILMEAYANELARKGGATQPILHGPLTPAMLKDARRTSFPVITHRDFRDSFLAWLAQRGAHGISDLLCATITRFIRGQGLDQSTVLG